MSQLAIVDNGREYSEWCLWLIELEVPEEIQLLQDFIRHANEKHSEDWTLQATADNVIWFKGKPLGFVEFIKESDPCHGREGCDEFLLELLKRHLLAPAPWEGPGK